MLHVIFIHCFSVLEFCVPIVWVFLGVWVIDVYFGVFVNEFQHCHGICLRFCCFCKHPVCSLQRALVFCGRCEKSEDVVCACAGVKIFRVGVISHVLVAEFVHHFFYVWVQVPSLAVRSGEFYVFGVIAVDESHKVVAAVKNEKSEGVAGFEIASNIIVVNVKHLSSGLRCINHHGFKFHWRAFVLGKRWIEVIAACRE